VHLALVMLTDGTISGQHVNEATGWWVDDFRFASGFPPPASFTGLTVSHDGVAGALVGVDTVDLALTSPQEVARAVFKLDCLPLGPGGLDMEVDNAGDQPAQFAIPATLRNQVAQLNVTVYNSEDAAGQSATANLTVYNLRGDANADNMVDWTDVSAIKQRLGAHAGDANYSLFCDTNGDGVIDEQDVAAVGYYWGASL
jgi:hypothetical protein